MTVDTTYKSSSHIYIYFILPPWWVRSLVVRHNHSAVTASGIPIPGRDHTGERFILIITQTTHLFAVPSHADPQSTSTQSRIVLSPLPRLIFSFPYSHKHVLGAF